MPELNSDILLQLKRDILSLEGLRSVQLSEAPELGLEAIKEAFPFEVFPTGAIHELIWDGKESLASTTGFVAGLLSGLMKKSGPVVWIGHSMEVFPPALKRFGIEPDNILFINLKKQEDVLWALEESLKCEGISAVVGELSGLSFTVSRRFQLAVEQSHTTGLILRPKPHALLPNACVSRWIIRSLPSLPADGLPGLGYSRWEVELQKIRNGKPGRWAVEWTGDRFEFIFPLIPSMLETLERKTG